MSEAVLSMRGIAKAYNRNLVNEIRILTTIDLDIHPGEIVGLLAPSGAGKSTLLHVAGLLDTPDSGSLTIAGTSLEGANDRIRTGIRRRDIGFVYQFHHLLPEFTALENVILPQLANGARQTEAAATAQGWLSHVGLSDRVNHRPAELSGGEQQRTALCRALANSPRLLLADEPTGNLDTRTSEQVFDMLLDAARTSGLAALIATHNVSLARRMDRVLRLESGRLVESSIDTRP